jgi:sec-independent protein translocase protein TatC
VDKDKPMSLLDHFAELRRRILVVSAFVLIASILCFLKAESILEYVTRGYTLIYTHPSEGMMAHFRIALTAGFIIASPVMLYQAVAFLAPALTRREKRVLLVAGLLMLLLLGGGLSFAWYVAFPVAMEFFDRFASGNLQPYINISEYLSFLSGLLLGFGLTFQLPLVFWVLGAFRILTSRFLRANRKYAVLLIFIVAAIATPPDVISQILMALPLLFLYELGIILVASTEKRRKRKETAGIEYN